jgi:hypothetical protein
VCLLPLRYAWGDEQAAQKRQALRLCRVGAIGAGRRTGLRTTAGGVCTARRARELCHGAGALHWGMDGAGSGTACSQGLASGAG